MSVTASTEQPDRLLAIKVLELLAEAGMWRAFERYHDYVRPTLIRRGDTEMIALLPCRADGACQSV